GPQVAEGELQRFTGLRVGEDGDLAGVPVAAEHVLRVVQPRAGAPLRARHRAGAEDALVRHARPDPEEVPQRGPEALEVGDRPLPELVVAREVEAALAPEP